MIPHCRTVPPAVWLPTQSLGSALNQEVLLSCHIEAFPSSDNFWIKESSGKTIESDNDKYIVQQETKDYKTHLILTIRRLEKVDFGLYSCLVRDDHQSPVPSICSTQLYTSLFLVLVLLPCVIICTRTSPYLDFLCQLYKASEKFCLNSFKITSCSKLISYS